MPNSIKTWDPDEWQNHVDLLLRLRHGPENFVPIPDKHGGDFGIEAFSLDGMAYQSYVPEEPLSTKELHEKQRDKINRDIKKFLKNKDALPKIFGDTLISRWVIVTPRHESAPLVQYVTQKTNEVRQANLPYVTQDFRILIFTEEDFAMERKKLVDEGIENIRVPRQEAENEAIDDWADQEISLINNLERKIKLMIPNSDELNHRRVRDDLIKFYLTGSNLLENLRSDYPEFSEKLRNCKRNRENSLTIESAITTDSPSKIFQDQLSAFKEEIQSQVISLSPSDINILGFEAVSDWLLRCPLDFPNEY